jgi:hypothetical protein
VIGAVPVTDLSETLLHGQGLTLGADRHVAVGQCVRQATSGGPELAEQVIGEPSFGRFNTSAGMVCHQPAQQRVRALNVAKMPGAVEWMEAAAMQGRCVADVMQPAGGGHHVGVAAEDRGECPGGRRDSLGMCPPARQRFFEKGAGDALCPGGLAHKPTVTGPCWTFTDAAGSSRDVWADRSVSSSGAPRRYPPTSRRPIRQAGRFAADPAQESGPGRRGALPGVGSPRPHIYQARFS